MNGIYYMRRTVCSARRKSGSGLLGELGDDAGPPVYAGESGLGRGDLLDFVGGACHASGTGLEFFGVGLGISGEVPDTP